MKILLTGGKSVVALRLLKAFTDYEVILADYGEVPLIVSEKYKLISLGIKNENTLTHTLLNNCLNEGVNAILPIYRFEVEALAKATTLFNEFNIEVLLPRPNLIGQYMKMDSDYKTDHWVVYNAGKLIFSSSIIDNVTEQQTVENLSGAFYISNHQEFELITIT